MKKSNKICVMAVFLIGLSISMGTIPMASAVTNSTDYLSIVHSIKSKSSTAEEYVGWTVSVEHYMTYDDEPRLRISISGSSKNINPSDPDNYEDGISFKGYVMVTSKSTEKWNWNCLISGYNFEKTTSYSELVAVWPEASERAIFFIGRHFEGRFSFSFTLKPLSGYEDGCSEEQDIYSRFEFVNSNLKPAFCDYAVRESITKISGEDQYFIYNLVYRDWGTVGTVSIDLERDGGSDIPTKPPIDPIPLR